MEYFKIGVSFILSVLMFLLFGKENISRLMQEDISIVESEKQPENIKGPGSKVYTFFLSFNSTFFSFIFINRNFSTISQT